MSNAIFYPTLGSVGLVDFRTSSKNKKYINIKVDKRYFEAFSDNYWNDRIQIVVEIDKDFDLDGSG